MHSYGRIKVNEFEEAIRKVTAKDVYEEMNSLFQRPPTIVLKGNSNLSKTWSDQKLVQALLKN